MSVLSEVAASLRAMAGGFLERLPYLALAVIVFVAVALAGMGVRAGVRAIAQRNRRHYNLGLVLGRLAQSLIVFLGLLIALVIAIPGFTAGELVSILGLSGVAIGFAFRDILQNFLAGILLLLAEPFRIGDQIVLDAFEGRSRRSRPGRPSIRTYDGRRVVVPNARLFVNTVTVNTAYDARRLEYDVGIGYGDDIERARRVVLDTLRAVPDVLRGPGARCPRGGSRRQQHQDPAALVGEAAAPDGRPQLAGPRADRRQPRPRRRGLRSAVPHAAGAVPRPDGGERRRPVASAGGLARGARARRRGRPGSWTRCAG